MRAVIALAVLLAAAAPARAQSGPFTTTLNLKEPTRVAFRLGPLMISPNLTVPEIGYDSNVFDEEVNPKTDWTASMAPDLQLYARAGLIQFAVSASSEFTYYAKYKSERSVSRQFRGRLDATLSRVRPWIAAASVDLHDRPNREIDLRARHTDREVSAGVAFEFTSIASFYGMAARTHSDFSSGEVFKRVNLDEALSRRGDQISGGIKIVATPFTTVLIDATRAEDRFAASPARNSRSSTASAQLEFAPEAILSGRAMVGYQIFEPADAAVPRHKGVVSNGALRYTVLGRATIDAVVERVVRYSFEAVRQYYVETGADLTYTHRVRGPYDVQARAARRWLDYTDVTPGLKPSVDSAGVGLGYNLQDGSRIGFNFEYTQRLDDIRPDRKFHRRRFFGTYTIER
jgi:hypothetical protein